MPKLDVQLSKKKLLLLGILTVVAVAIPITIYLVQTQLRSTTQATPNTTLAFSPSNVSASVGEDVTFDINISPGNNQVNNIRLVLKYDSTKLDTVPENFIIDPASQLTILEGPVISTDTFSVSLSIGSDPTKVITTDTTIGTITFTVIGESALPTDITFDPTTQIRSSGDTDGDAPYDENVFLSGTPAIVTILDADGQVPETSLTPSPIASPSPEASPAASPTPEYQGLSEVPICSSIGLDVPAAGIAPYTINFTVSGSDIDGTIESVSFDFGDGTFEDVTSGGGISTDTVDVTLAHTYDTPGNYVVSAILTDDTGETSDTNSCTTSVTITDEFGNTDTVDDIQDEEIVEDVTPTLTPTATPSLPPTGPTETIVGMGALGAVLFMIGALLFFAL